MAELRKDPIIDRWVVVAESRSRRPGAFLGNTGPRPEIVAPRGSSIDSCPFCVGNETQTPPAVYEQQDAAGDWNVRIIPNRYPAVLDPSARAGRLAEGKPAVGLHEVVIESPDHATDWEQLSSDEVERVLRAWRDRLAEHRRDGRWKIAFLFQNAGREAGASLEHVHSQILALPRVPELIERELNAASAFHRRTAQCAFCCLIGDERQAASRVLLEDSHFLAIAAYAGRQPYEMWILPREHQAAFDTADDAALRQLAVILVSILHALRQVLPGCAYNLVLHTSPFDTQWSDRYHWHIEIIPRVTRLAGYELGGGEFINPVAPERAAREIKDILSPAATIR